MKHLVQDDFTRATTFFALTFFVAVLVGFALGDVALGVEWGFTLGIAFAAFAYVFLVPTDDGSAEGNADGTRDADE